MPKLGDTEIQDLLAAIEEGRVKPDQATGYREVADAVPSIAKKVKKDSHWAQLFSNWWSKYKKKLNANKAITPLQEQEPEPSNPSVPPAASKQASQAEKDHPPAKKPPKKKVRNHPKVEPASDFDFSGIDWDSVETTTVDVTKEHQACEDAYNLLFSGKLDGDLQDDTSSTKPKATSPKMPTPGKTTGTTKPPPTTPPRPTTTTTTKKSPEAEIMSAMTPEEKCYALFEATAMPPTLVKLDMGGNHVAEIYKVFWVDSRTHVMHITCVVPGATSAWMEGGKMIKIVFPRMYFMTGLREGIERACAQNLTNPNCRRSFESFANMLDHMNNTMGYPSMITGELPIHEFEAEEEFANNLFDSYDTEEGRKGGGLFPVGPNGERCLIMTVVDKKKPRSKTLAGAIGGAAAGAAALCASPMRQGPPYSGLPGAHGSPGHFGTQGGYAGYGSPAHGYGSPYGPPQGYGSAHYGRGAYGQGPPQQGSPPDSNNQALAAIAQQLQALTMQNQHLQQQISAGQAATTTALVPSPRGGQQTALPTVQTVDNNGNVSPLAGGSVSGSSFHTTTQNAGHSASTENTGNTAVGRQSKRGRSGRYVSRYHDDSIWKKGNKKKTLTHATE